MMPRWLAAAFLIGVGAVFLWLTRRGYTSGEVPAGSAWFRSYRPNRDDNPVGFHFYLVVYFCLGIGVCVWGLLVMLGMAPALKWR
jgi:hypothetical protein